MTWTRLSDDFADRPDLALVSRSGRLLFVEMLIYCNRHANDGAVRRALVARMTDAEDWKPLLEELVDHGIVTEHDHGERLQINWTAWGQEPAARVRERREINAEANRAYRDRQMRHRRGDHSTCTASCPAKASPDSSRDSLRDGPRDGSRDVYLSRPLPSPPVPKGQGGGEGGGPALADAARTASQRLGIAPHPPAPDCCPLPTSNPIHAPHEQVTA